MLPSTLENTRMKNKNIVSVITGWGIGLALSCAQLTTTAGDSAAGTARSVVDKHKESVVWVSAVARMSFSSGDSTPLPMNIPDREQKFEANGTVLEPTGLTVTALSSLDPTREITGREINTSSGRITIEASAVLKEVKIILSDGTEVPADIVMKDADLDLAFLRPKADAKETKQASFKPLDLKSSSTAELADEVINLSRSDEVLNRQPSVHRGQIMCVTQKPRTFYRVAGAMTGCPTFALDGKVLGIAVNRFMKDKNTVTVVLPASDVLEIAEQARNAKPLSSDDAGAAGEKANSPAKPN